MENAINILKESRDKSLFKISFIRRHYKEEFKKDAIDLKKHLIKELNDAILILEANSKP